MLVPLLLGLGVDALSMSPPQIPEVRYLIRSMKMSDAKQLADEALKMSSPEAIYQHCQRFYKERMERFS